MSEYNQVRSFNLGIAEDTSVEAAMIYDDLAYAQKVFGKGYFYRSDDQMLKRFPIFSKNTIRRHVAKLVEAGWISTKVEKVDGKPILHYQIEQSLLPKLSKTMEIPKMGKTYNDKETKKETKNDDSLLIQIIDLVNPREKPTADRRRALAARLKDYTADEIMAAARAFSKSKWHRENKQMSVDNLLAPSKFGRWYAQKVEVQSVAGDVTEQDDDGTTYVNGQEVTVENQDEMVRRRMGGGDVTN